MKLPIFIIEVGGEFWATPRAETIQTNTHIWKRVGWLWFAVAWMIKGV